MTSIAEPQTGRPLASVAQAAVEPQEPQAEQEKDDGRDYVILKRVPGASPGAPQTWEFVVNVQATSTEQAVRRAAEQPGTSFLNPDGPTTLVAVPARSFNPISLQVQTTTKIIIA